MSLYLKYRPSDLEHVRGNVEVVETLTKMLEDKEKCPHSFLLHGPTGTGKTTLARIIANMLGVVGNDYREINAADFRGIDTIREIIKNSQYKPMEGSCRMWVLDEAHKITGDGANALLKIIEEPPRHVYFVLCTTEFQKVIGTIRGRCSKFQMKPLNEVQMLGLLRRIVKDEGATMDKEVYDQIIQDSLGLPRNAISTLEQVLAIEPEKRLEVAEQFVVQQAESIALCRALIDGSGWKVVRKILDGLQEQDPEGIRRHVLGYCNSVLLKNDQHDLAGLIMGGFMEPTYTNGFSQLIYAAYSVVRHE